MLSDTKFSVYMSLAVSIKYILLFAYVPMLLAKYMGKLRKLIVVGLPTIFVLVLSGIIQYLHYYVAIPSSADSLLKTRAGEVIGNYVFLTVYITFLIFIAFRVVKKTILEQDVLKWAMYSALTGLCIFMTFFSAQLYWLILLETIAIVYCTMYSGFTELLLEEIYMLVLVLCKSVPSDFIIMGNAPYNYLLLYRLYPKETQTRDSSIGLKVVGLTAIHVFAVLLIISTELIGRYIGNEHW